MLLAEKDFYLVPIILECFDQTFDDLEGECLQGQARLIDFSAPGVHHYKRWGMSLRSPGIAEDDSIAAYTHWYAPQPGDLVFDAGANAGLTTCVLARMVGPTGRVIAFEPDQDTRPYLERNIKDLRLANITIVPKALDAQTGSACFNADSTMGAGLADYSVYGKTGRQIQVETLSLEDACRTYGIPRYIKMDIEGAEIRVIEAASDFLQQHPIHLAFDSYHRMRDGRYTWMLLEPLFRSMGYEVASSTEFGQMFTWAKRPTQKARTAAA